MNPVPRTRMFPAKVVAVNGAAPGDIAIASGVSYSVSGLDPLSGSPYNGEPRVVRPYSDNIEVRVAPLFSFGTLFVTLDAGDRPGFAPDAYFMPHEEHVVFEECPVGARSMTRRVFGIIRQAFRTPNEG